MADLADWRGRIDEIDGELLTLLNRRAECAIEIGKIKQDRGLPIYNPDREKDIMARLQDLNGGPLPDPVIRGIFNKVIEACKNLE